MEPYFLMSLSAIGALFLLGASLVRGALNGLRSDVGDIGKEQSEQGERLVRMETILTGADGTNGLNGEVKQLRSRSHAHGDAIHTVNGTLQAHEFRLDELDRRIGPVDRRRPA